jgi:hypothetical protein
VGGAVDIVGQDGDVVDLIELAQFFRVGELLLEAIVVRVVFTGVSFASVNDEKLETEFWVLPITAASGATSPTNGGHVMLPNSSKTCFRPAKDASETRLPSRSGKQNSGARPPTLATDQKSGAAISHCRKDS